MPDPFGPGWALGANRPPAGRMTRAGRWGPSPAPGAVAGRPVAGGLSSGTVAHGGHGCPTTTGPGRAVDAARPGRDPHARVFEGGRFAFRAGGSSCQRGGCRVLSRVPGANSPGTSSGLSLPACPSPRGRAGCSGPGVHLGMGPGDPGPSVALVSDVVCPRQRPFRIPPDPWQRCPPRIRHSGI